MTAPGLAELRKRAAPGPTARQKQLLQLVHRRQMEGLSSPSIQELMAAMAITSTNGVVDHLKALRRRQLLEWTPREARSLRLTAAGRAAIGAPCCSCRCHEKPEGLFVVVPDEPEGAAADPDHGF